jgi:hypothetical protein
MRSGPTLTAGIAAAAPSPTGTTPTGTIDLSAVAALLQQILGELQKEYDQGQVSPPAPVDLLTINNTVTLLYTSPKPVRGGLMQNLSNTDTITLNFAQKGKAALFAAGSGIVLNPATVSGYGGGTWAFWNIDLSTASAITSTNNNQTLAVLYYT